MATLEHDGLRLGSFARSASVWLMLAVAAYAALLSPDSILAVLVRAGLGGIGAPGLQVQQIKDMVHDLVLVIGRNGPLPPGSAHSAPQPRILDQAP